MIQSGNGWESGANADRVPLDVWRAVAFALCVQCAAEEALVFDFVGECGHELRIRRWISQKACEHGRHAGIEGVGDDFLNVIKEGVQSGTTLLFKSTA